ncbi:uncharacterized protein LOC142203010 [Leptodactylus fuscus]|uniref:uncharacterized protein LOC142203010 n=1 Tax=Leptodactylus fuscus TaxID=238119 RepID=UPI003F4E9164
MVQDATAFGVPLAVDKTEGPVTELSFLGLTLDTVAMECKLPENKLEDLKGAVKRECQLKNLQLRELQSLLVGSFSEIGANGGSRRAPVAEGIVADASQAAEELINASMVAGTWGAYAAAWKQWEEWLVRLGGAEEDWDMMLLLFIGHCRELGWSVSKLNMCMAGLAFGFKRRGMRDLTKVFLVKLAFRGWRRGNSIQDDRRPVSFGLLVDLRGVLESVCSSNWERRLFRAAFSLAFFGALRLGELVSTAKPGGVLLEDVDLYEYRVEFRLRRSKTVRKGKGLMIRLFAIAGCAVCPVLCLREYLSFRGRGFGPLLIHENSMFLSRFQFLSVFRKGLKKLGMEVEGFSSHSFQIGEATEATIRGLGEDLIKKIGHWESRRFHSYMRLGL